MGCHRHVSDDDYLECRGCSREEFDRAERAEARVAELREAAYRLLMVQPPSAVSLCRDEIARVRDALDSFYVAECDQYGKDGGR